MGDRWTDPSRPCESFSCSQTGMEVEKTVCPLQTCAEVRMTKLTSVSQSDTNCSEVFPFLILFSIKLMYYVFVRMQDLRVWDEHHCCYSCRFTQMYIT